MTPALTKPSEALRAMILAATALALASCSDPQGTKEAAEAQGLTNVRPSGHSFFGCGQEDTYSTSFSARSANGQCVSGVVCSSWLKGSTVRITGKQSCEAGQ